MRVAVIGLGAMGRALAERARATGHDVIGWNRSPGKAGDLPEASTAAEAAHGADVVFVVVYDGAAVEQVCDDALFEALAPQALLAVVSTVSPSTVRSLESHLPGRVLDTPILGSPTAVAQGGARFFVGGTAEAAATLAPLLADLSAGQTHCGPLGAGLILKIAANLQLVTGVAALAEAISLARRQGISDDVITSVFGDLPVVSPASRLRLPTVLDPTHPGWFGAAAASKDLTLALDLAGDLRLALTPAALDLLGRIADGGWGDFAAVIEGL
jgi:3-hydroxyisobutyrate dehydrogenase